MAPDDEDACKAAIHGVIGSDPARATMIDLYVHYGSVRIEKSGSVPRSSAVRASGVRGAGLRSSGLRCADATDCSLLLREVGWLRFCEESGYGNHSTAAQLFESVNEMRDASLEATKARPTIRMTARLHTHPCSCPYVPL